MFKSHTLYGALIKGMEFRDKRTKIVFEDRHVCEIKIGLEDSSIKIFMERIDNRKKLAIQNLRGRFNIKVKTSDGSILKLYGAIIHKASYVSSFPPYPNEFNIFLLCEGNKIK